MFFALRNLGMSKWAEGNMWRARSRQCCVSESGLWHIVWHIWWGICTRRAGKLCRARSRLYRSRLCNQIFVGKLSPRATLFTRFYISQISMFCELLSRFASSLLNVSQNYQNCTNFPKWYRRNLLNSRIRTKLQKSFAWTRRILPRFREISETFTNLPEFD